MLPIPLEVIVQSNLDLKVSSDENDIPKSLMIVEHSALDEGRVGIYEIAPTDDKKMG